MHSGYGSLLKTHIKEAVEVFRQHVILHDNGNVLLNMKDTRQYFVNFVRAGQRTSQELHMLLQGLEKAAVRRRTSRPLPLRAACGRTAHLPGLPHPRRSATPDRTIPPSGTKRPVRGRRKPRRRHRKSRNRNPAETPHSGIRNATPQHVPSVAFTPREVWHFTPRSVASEGVKPFMYNHLPDKRTKRQRDKNEKTSTSFCQTKQIPYEKFSSTRH